MRLNGLRVRQRTPPFVIPAPQFVIPAKAEIQGAEGVVQMAPKWLQQPASIFMPWCASASRHERLL